MNGHHLVLVSLLLLPWRLLGAPPPRRRTTPTAVLVARETTKNTTTAEALRQEEEEAEDQIGGGAINEKRRTFTTNAQTSSSGTHRTSSSSQFCATSQPAHFWHALEGLARYPHYLSRWSDEDIVELETAVATTLDHIRAQKCTIAAHRRRLHQQLLRRRLSTTTPPPGAHQQQEIKNKDAPAMPEAAVPGPTTTTTTTKQYWKDLCLTAPTNWQELQDAAILDPVVLHAILHSSMFRPQSRSRSPSRLHPEATPRVRPPPTLNDILAGQVSVDLDVEHLTRLMDEEAAASSSSGGGVYSFPLFTTEFCHKLRTYLRSVLEEREHVETDAAATRSKASAATGDTAGDDTGDTTSTGDTTVRIPRSMVRDLDNCGLGWLNDLVFQLLIRPIAQQLYNDDDTQGDLDWRHGFVAAYAASPTRTTPRQHLVPHTDDAEVTLNICLGDAHFTGGQVQVWGLRGDDEVAAATTTTTSSRPASSSSGGGSTPTTYRPVIGRALIHAGRELHGVTPITSGDRYAYVIWTRSWQGIRAKTCPCCWLNRRRDTTCICGRRWN